MCEHAGMLNHIYAKLTDLRVGEGEVIPQTGPQCFDISVWQMVGALLVGGRTLLVDQEVTLDVERLVDTIVAGRASVLQVVPSYLDVIVSYLEHHPRELPDLHTACPTGDFLKKDSSSAGSRFSPGSRWSTPTASPRTRTTPSTRSWTGCRMGNGSRSAAPSSTRTSTSSTSTCHRCPSAHPA